MLIQTYSSTTQMSPRNIPSLSCPRIRPAARMILLSAGLGIAILICFAMITRGGRISWIISKGGRGIVCTGRSRSCCGCRGSPCAGRGRTQCLPTLWAAPRSQPTASARTKAPPKAQLHPTRSAPSRWGPKPPQFLDCYAARQRLTVCPTWLP